MNAISRLSRPPRRRERGVVLFIALIVLVAMALAGVAMIRSVDTAVGVAGNMSFRQAALHSSDSGVLTAYNWLSANFTATLNSDDGAGYFASQPGSEPNWYSASDPVWTNAKLVNAGTPDGSGNVTRYVVHRICSCAAGYLKSCPSSANINVCATFTPSAGGTSGNSMAVGSFQFTGNPELYYRVTTRVDGPHNAVSIVQVFVLGPAT